MVEGKQIGRFLIQQELGHGGMGTVYRAEDPVIGRHVAIKVIRLDDTGPPEVQRQLAQSFLREIHTAGVLQHPGIVSIFDAGKQDNVAYIVMELVAGVTFEAMLHAEPRPPLETMLGVCRQAATALDYAHAHGVLHRDVKPSNILVQANGIVKIVDFGIAKIAQANTLMMSQTGTTLGTPDYMSPEQVLGKPLDGRTDQWSLAVVAYIALTGIKPFGGEHFTHVMGRIMTRDPEPPCTLNPALPRQADAVILKALDKDSAKRYGTCSEFMSALEAACAGQSAPVVQVSPAARATPVTPMVPAPPAAPTFQSAHDAPTAPGLPVEPPPKKTSRWSLVAAGLLLVALAGAAIVGLRLYRPAEPAPPSATPVPAPIPTVTTRTTRPRTKAAEPGRPAETNASEAKKSGADTSEVAPPPATATHLVKLITTPPDAVLTVDSKPESACHSPCTVELPAGSHAVHVTKEGYYALQKTIEVNTDLQEIPFVLEQAGGGPLRIVTVPDGATISVDGTVLASPTPTVLHLSMGSHTIRLTKDGFADYSTSVSVESSLGQGISVKLVAAH